MSIGMTGEIIAKALGGRKTGGGWMARCPAHDDREPSLSIRSADSDAVLVRCHAGCEQAAVIAALRSRGLWPEKGRTRFKLGRPRACKTEPGHVRDDPARTEIALRNWRTAILAVSTPVEVYLQSRGIIMPPPTTLRFHRGIKHPSGGIWPAMVALVTRGTDDTPLAIHRTFLSRNGSGKAPVEPTKMILGPCRRGAVRLGPIGELVMIAEGIETALSAMQATGNPAWAALSTSGLRTLDLPRDVHDVIILADGDAPGEAAARDCAWRWKREGRRVRIARPPRGFDFNDLLTGNVSHSVGGVAERSAITRQSLVEKIEEARQAAMEAGQYSAAVSAAKEIAVLLGIRIERSERGAPGEFDWVDRLNLEELRALAKGELDVEAYRKDPRTVN